MNQNLFYGFRRGRRRFVEQYLQFGKKLLVLDGIYSLNVALHRFALHRWLWYDFRKVTVRLDRCTILQQDVYFALIVPTTWTWIEWQTSYFQKNKYFIWKLRLTWTQTLCRWLTRANWTDSRRFGATSTCTNAQRFVCLSRSCRRAQHRLQPRNIIISQTYRKRNR